MTALDFLSAVLWAALVTRVVVGMLDAIGEGQ